MIDKTTSEIIEDDSSDDVYTTLDQIAEVLPDTIPRFVVMSYPLELVGFPHLLILIQIR